MSRVKEILNLPLDYMELLLSYAYIGWSIILFFNPELFIKSVNYAPLDQLMPEFYWCVVIGITGVIQLIGVLSKNRTFRIIAPICGIMIWSMIATSFAITHAIPTGVLIYGSFAFTNLSLLIQQVKSGKDQVS